MDSREGCRTPQGEEGRAEPVLLLTPTGRDAAVAVACLQAAGIRTQICHDVAEVWISWRGGRRPTTEELADAVIHYAMHDAYLEPEGTG